MEIEDINADYSRLRPRYEQLKDEITYILNKELAARGIAIHMLEGRVKTLESLIAKTEQQELERPFDEMVDICGIRIISLFLSDMAKIGKLLEEIFQLESTDDKITTKPAEEFGYLSVHYVGQLPETFSGPRYDEIKGLRFEVQVRTIAMHAWATISHYLDYKSQNAIPSELRRDFNALSAMFYIADSHFEMFFRSSEAAKQLAEQKAGDAVSIGSEEINLDTLSAYLNRKFKSLKHSSSTGVSNLVDELVASNYRTIAQVDLDVDRAKNAFDGHEKKYPPNNKRGNKYADIGVVRISLTIANEEFLNTRRPRINNTVSTYEEFRKFLEPVTPATA